MKASDKKRESTRSTFKLLFYLNRSKAQKDGSMPIVCRISVDGKSESLSTGQKCRDEDWDKLLKMPKSKTKQKALQELRQQIENHYQGLLHQEGVVSASLLKVRVQQSEAPLDNLQALGTYELEQVQLSVGHTRSQVTYEHNRRVQQRLLDFIEKRGLSSDLRQIDLSFYEAYKLYLKDYHPERLSDESFISARSEMAAEVYEKSFLRGNNPYEAHNEAIASLLEGLEFSPYMIVEDIVEQELKLSIPSELNVPLSKLLMAHPEERKYLASFDFSDDFEDKAEFQSFRNELIGLLTEIIEGNNLLAALQTEPS